MKMKFSKLSEDIQAALIQFCFEQDEAVNYGYTCEEEMTRLAESAFAVFDRIADAAVKVAPVYRYEIYAGEQYSNEIFPFEVRENSIIYSSAVLLGTFNIDGYVPCDDNGAVITRGYDVIYDVDSEKIRLLYRIHTTDDNMTSVYRVNTDFMEYFNVYEFVIDLSAQFIAALKEGSENI